MAGALDGVHVLDFSIWRPAPYATQLLAERGATVTKIEPPGGDPMRAYGGLFDELNRLKESIELDLKSDMDRAQALELARNNDVVLEGFRPGVADRLGIGYDDIKKVNPSVVYCSLTGFGQTGPLSMVPGHDINYLAWSGSLAPDGGEPRWPAIPVADCAGGMAAAFEITAALVNKQRTGDGARIDVSMTDVIASWVGPTAPRAEGVERTGPGVPGYGIFATTDGFVVLGIISEDPFWRNLCTSLGLDDIASLGFADRMPRVGELQDRIAAAIKTHERDDLVGRLLAADVPVAPVLTRKEMLARRRD